MASAWLCLSLARCIDTSLAFDTYQPKPCLKQRLVSSLYVYTSFNRVYLRISSLLLFVRLRSFSEHAEKREKNICYENCLKNSDNFVRWS